MVNEPQQLIAELKRQHLELRSELVSVQEKTTLPDTVDGNAIILDLAKFKEDLEEHTKLESNTLYPDYLTKKMARGESIDSIHNFMDQISTIEQSVMSFLDKYSTAESVEKSAQVFSNDLNEIISTLATRIESEEMGVFDVYLAY